MDPQQIKKPIIINQTLAAAITANKNENILDLLDIHEEEAVKELKSPNHIFDLMEGNKPRIHEKIQNNNNNVVAGTDLFSNNSSSSQKIRQCSTIVPFEVIYYISLNILYYMVNFLVSSQRNRYRNQWS